MFVNLPDGRGVGKLQAGSDGLCTVEIFYSTVRNELSEFPAAELERAYLSPQTRVYVKQGDAWRAGRVTHYLSHENGLVDYEVRFPNGRQADFSEVELYVRPWNAPDDPAEVLASGGAESQFLHSRRHLATSRLLDLNSSCQGLTALISAYSLTVANGVDNILARIDASQAAPADWWRELTLASRSRSFRELLQSTAGLILVAAPTTYLAMVRADLEALDANERERLRLFTAAPSSAVSASLRSLVMPYDRRLEALPRRSGTLSDFAQRALRHFADEILPAARSADLEMHSGAVLKALTGAVPPPKRRGRSMSDE